MKAESGGVGFFFAREQEARKFLDFVQEVVPCRYVASKKLKTHNTHDNYYNDKHNYSIEIVAVCRENIVALPKKLAQSLGNLSQICICIHVTNLISLIDLFFSQSWRTSGWNLLREPFTAVCTQTANWICSYGNGICRQRWCMYYRRSAVYKTYFIWRLR